MISFTMSKWNRLPEADDISLYVQDCGGYFEIHRDNVEFYIPVEYRDFLILRYPFLNEIEYVH
jgi:hypothetical protein